MCLYINEKASLMLALPIAVSCQSPPDSIRPQASQECLGLHRLRDVLTLMSALLCCRVPGVKAESGQEELSSLASRQPEARWPSEGNHCLVFQLCRRGDCVQRRTVTADIDASDQLPPGKLPRAQLKKMCVSSQFEKKEKKDLHVVFNRSLTSDLHPEPSSLQKSQKNVVSP